MKSGVAALVVAVAEHAASCRDCRGVQVVLTSGEETGCDGALALPASALALRAPRRAVTIENSPITKKAFPATRASKAKTRRTSTLIAAVIPRRAQRLQAAH